MGNFLSYFSWKIEENFEKRFTNAVEMLPLVEYEKDIIKKRYIQIVVKAEREHYKTRVIYIFLTNLITIAGVLIASLVSLEKVCWLGTDAAIVIFWFIWSLSIALTLSNKWLHAFNIHKKYVLNTVILEKFYSEGWAFVSGINRYSRYHDMTTRFKVFCTRIEKIKMKSIENMPGIETIEVATDILGAGGDVSHNKKIIQQSNADPNIIINGDELRMEEINMEESQSVRDESSDVM